MNCWSSRVWVSLCAGAALAGCATAATVDAPTAPASQPQQAGKMAGVANPEIWPSYDYPVPYSQMTRPESPNCWRA